jgi:hypothetical protein
VAAGVLGHKAAYQYLFSLRCWLREDAAAAEELAEQLTACMNDWEAAEAYAHAQVLLSQTLAHQMHQQQPQVYQQQMYERQLYQQQQMYEQQLYQQQMYQQIYQQHQHQQQEQEQEQEQEQQRRQQQHISAAGEATAAPGVAAVPPAAPMSAPGMQQAAAAAQGASGGGQRVTVGQVKHAGASPHLKSALNMWAGLCCPGQNVNSVRISTLLQHSSSFTDHLLQQVAAGVMKADTARKYLYPVRTWLQQQPQLLAGVEGVGGHLLEQLSEVFTRHHAAYKTQQQHVTRQKRIVAAAWQPGTAEGAGMDIDWGAAVEVQEEQGQEQPAGQCVDPTTAGTQSADSPWVWCLMPPGVAGAQEASLSGVTFAELQQALPPTCSSGLDMLWTVAQQPEAYGPAADPAAVPVALLLAPWADPDTLQECRDSFSTEEREQLAAIFEGLQGLVHVLQQPLLRQVLGGQQQLQLLMNVHILAEACMKVLLEGAGHSG